MSDNFSFMQADKTLTSDLEKAQTPDEIRELLLRAVERSAGQLGVERDEATGRFVSARNPQNPPAVQPAEEEHVFTKTATIGGREFEFTAASEEALEQMIAQAREVAEAVRPAEQSTGAFETVRRRMQEAGDEAERQAELRLKFERGELSPADYLEQSGALDVALAERGFDVERASNDQLEKSWAEATEEFLNGPAGSDWPGGPQNLKIIGSQIIAMGLQDAENKVAALSTAWEEMKKAGTVMPVGPTEEQILAETAKLSPQEILERWKEGQGYDPEIANQNFMRLNSSTGSSSSLFGK